MPCLKRCDINDYNSILSPHKYEISFVPIIKPKIENTKSNPKESVGKISTHPNKGFQNQKPHELKVPFLWITEPQTKQKQSSETKFWLLSTQQNKITRAVYTTIVHNIIANFQITQS